jgi:hypothetical protein
VFVPFERDKLGDLAATSAIRQKELELLNKLEQEAADAKQKEQAEIAKRENELAVLDKQIVEMKGRLGSGTISTNGNLDSIVAMVDQKEKQAKRLEELRQLREAEEKKRQQDIARLKQIAINKRTKQVSVEVAKYEKIVASKYSKELKDAAWNALVGAYPEAKGVIEGDVKGFSMALEIDLDSFVDPISRIEFTRVKNYCYDNKCYDLFVSKRLTANYQYRLYQSDYIGDNDRVYADNMPAVKVSWQDAINFSKWLSKASNNNYRLLNEHEWQYICKNGGHSNCSDIMLGESLIDVVVLRGSDLYEKYYKNSFDKLGLNGIQNIWEWNNDSCTTTDSKNTNYNKSNVSQVIRGYITGASPGGPIHIGKGCIPSQTRGGNLGVRLVFTGHE